MATIDPAAFVFAIQRVEDGFLFEKLAQDLLACFIGIDFVPAGGVADKGIDGLTHCLSSQGQATTIYQISIDRSPEAKIEDSLEKLRRNDISCDRFVFVTNQVIKDVAKTEERFFQAFGTVVLCRDINWLRAQTAANENAIRVYHTFVESHLHEYAKTPDDDFLVLDFSEDPRVFVFISQQWEEYRGKQDFESVAVDSLILLALEGTDPDQGILRNRSEIYERIMGIFPHARLIDQRLDERLRVLATKPRRIRHHKIEDGYCLPFETRLELDEKNLEDRALHDGFFESACSRLTKHLNNESVKIRAPSKLMQEVVRQCFLKQGLQFSDFVHKADSQATFEISLSDVVSSVVDGSEVMQGSRQKVKGALLATIREVLYQGSETELAYLRRLSGTYTMLFLMQGDPTVAAYFAALAKKLYLFVDNSILIPAFSEYYLEPRNRRFWNLLVAAKNSGVTLRINQVTIAELAGHINRVADIYIKEYQRDEEVYLDEETIRYVDEILLRSYFYQKMRGFEGTFHRFLDNFATPNSTSIEDDLIEYLKEEFGIRYQADTSLGVRVEAAELEALAAELEAAKGNQKRAENDARTILTIFALRDKNNERGDGGVFGYKTWWLSQDTRTYKAVEECFRDKYKPSCYLRPDFLYTFIALAPNHQQSQAVFDTLFPSLLGVSVSHHVDRSIINAIRAGLGAHQDKSAARRKAAVRNLTDRLKTDNNLVNPHRLRNFLDEELGRAT